MWLMCKYCRLEFICDGIFREYLRTFEIAKNTMAKNFNGYIVIKVVMNFRKNFSIAKVFPSRFLFLSVQA